MGPFVRKPLRYGASANGVCSECLRIVHLERWEDVKTKKTYLRCGNCSPTDGDHMVEATAVQDGFWSWVRRGFGIGVGLFFFGIIASVVTALLSPFIVAALAELVKASG